MFDRLSTIWTILEGQRLRYAAALVSLLVASMLLSLVPIVAQVVLDGVLGEGSRDHSIPEQVGLWAMGGRAFLETRLWIPCLVVVGLTALAGFATYFRGRWSAIAAERVVKRLRDRLHDHLNHIPCRWYDDAETGDVLQRCTSDVDTLRNFLALQLVEIGRAATMLLLPIPIMLMIDVGMTIVSLALIPFIVFFSLFFFGKVKSEFRKKDEAEGRLTACVNENLAGIRVVRAFARQDFEREKFRVRNDEHRELDYRLYAIMSRFWSISDFLCFMQKAIVIIAGAMWMAAGTLEVGAFYFFLAAVSMYVWPVRQMGRILAELGKAVVAVDRIQEIMETPPEISVEAPVAIAGGTGDIEFDGVSFTHGDRTPVLHDVSFKVAKGETLALVAPSGGGKSTIINLLLRLYEHEVGVIRFGGVEIERIGRGDLRSRFGVVMQDPFLYSRSIRDNIAIGRVTTNDEELHVAARVACIHESILDFDEGYETVVGERGVTLSGGQRQRVAIARAIVADPDVLVLDDALSAVDTRTERLILEALRSRRGRQTTIVIAHRLSTLRQADQVLVLDHGRIVQRGTHDELVDQDGMYRRLWDLQTTIESLEDLEASA